VCRVIRDFVERLVRPRSWKMRDKEPESEEWEDMRAVRARERVIELKDEEETREEPERRRTGIREPESWLIGVVVPRRA